MNVARGNFAVSGEEQTKSKSWHFPSEMLSFDKLICDFVTKVLFTVLKFMYQFGNKFSLQNWIGDIVQVFYDFDLALSTSLLQKALRVKQF
jgi:hypothetical protein